MASDWEQQLKSWGKPPSDNEDSKRNRTEEQIRAALNSAESLSSVGFWVYAKGSYANNTNVRLDYDVDIAVECTDFFYHEQYGAAAADVRKAAALESVLGSAASYGPREFKNDVEAALTEYFGSAAVSRGNMALRVREKKTTLPADVVACAQYRWIYDVNPFDGTYSYHQGTRIYPDHGSYIHNWPDQQYRNGVAKNDRTGRRYKRMVRALKRLENELAASGTIAALPSFFMECLVYNVPDEGFNHSTYLADMRYILATIYNETRDSQKCKDWHEVSELKYLFHPSQGWTNQQAAQLADAAWNLIGFE